MKKRRIFKTLNLADELRSGRHYGVFVDDTGSPGLHTPGLHAKRKSWVAVVVPPSKAAEVIDQVPNALSYLKELGLEEPEFHFTDILSGKGQYAKLDLPKRLAIFGFMAEIFSTYRFPVFVQTFDPENALDVQRRSDLPRNFGPLKFNNHQDLALIFLMMRVRQYLKTLGATACVIVDQGRLAEGRSIVLSGLAPTFCGGAIFFASSRKVHPIQLADFAAFALNRWQILRVKETLSELDKTLLRILSPVAECFSNIDLVRFQDEPTLTNLRDGLN